LIERLPPAPVFRTLYRMKEFLVGLLLVLASFLSPLAGGYGDRGRSAPLMPDSINDDADPVGTVTDPGPAPNNGKGEPGAAANGQTRASH